MQKLFLLVQCMGVEICINRCQKETFKVLAIGILGPEQIIFANVSSFCLQSVK